MSATRARRLSLPASFPIPVWWGTNSSTFACAAVCRAYRQRSMPARLRRRLCRLSTSHRNRAPARSIWGPMSLSIQTVMALPTGGKRSLASIRWWRMPTWTRIPTRLPISSNTPATLRRSMTTMSPGLRSLSTARPVTTRPAPAPQLHHSSRLPVLWRQRTLARLSRLLRVNTWQATSCITLPTTRI